MRIKGTFAGTPPYSSSELREHERKLRDPQDLDEALLAMAHEEKMAALIASFNKAGFIVNAAALSQALLRQDDFI